MQNGTRDDIARRNLRRAISQGFQGRSKEPDSIESRNDCANDTRVIVASNRTLCDCVFRVFGVIGALAEETARDVAS